MHDVTALSAYGILLVSAFLSATLLPGSSEVVLIGFLAQAKGQPGVLIAVATIGNVAGSLMNYALGRFAQRFKDKKWFPVSDATNTRAKRWFARYGVWSLLLSWVPLLGDPLTLIAGVMRINLWLFLVLVAMGKLMRYGFVYAAWSWWGAV
jgi:membrane protein YqaA with SNARE-associated domain